MAKVEKIVPFIIQFEAGISPALGLSAAQLFERARRTGFANDPADLGGATMVGVTLATYTNFCRCAGRKTPTVADLQNISFADWLAILKTSYWDRWQADKIKSQSVAEILVDFVWGSGKYGITVPQQVLGVTPDGIVGSQTLAAVNSRNPRELFDALLAARIAYIDRICATRPANNKFKKGWLRRINSIKFTE